MDIVETNTYWAAGLGLVPVPLFDIVAITGIQLKMIKEITEYYGQKFNKVLAKSIVTSLLGGVGATAATYGAIGPMASAVPAIGPILGIVAMPIIGGATTYAVGCVFVTYYENGGQFELFDSEAPDVKDLMEKLTSIEDKLNAKK